MTNPLTKLFKSFMTNTPPVFSDNDNGPDIQFGQSMSVQPAEFKTQAPHNDLPTNLGDDAKSVFDMYALLSPGQRLEFTAAALRTYCAGCGNVAPADGQVCKFCNGVE